MNKGLPTVSMSKSVPNGRPRTINVNAIWSIADIPTETPASSITAADRLVKVRIGHGYETAVDAARAMGISVITYHHHENGKRNISVRAARIYASHYGVAGGAILYGDQSAPLARVQVAGAVTATGKITEHMPCHPSRPLTVQAPVFTDEPLQAYVVEASDLMPAYHPGDVVYTGIPNGIRHNEVHGRECVVRTEDGRMGPSRPGRRQQADVTRNGETQKGRALLPGPFSLWGAYFVLDFGCANGALWRCGMYCPQTAKDNAK